MTKMLEEAIAKVRELPEQDQDVLAAAILSMTGDSPLVQLDAETRAAVQEGLAQARRGEFVSDQDMAAFFRRHGLKHYGA